VQFKVLEPDAAFVLDPQAGVKPGERNDVVTVLTIEDGALAELVKNPGSAANLYQRGKLRIDGELAAAKSLGFLEGLV
jgi:3-hydroxyacyl-CoA dehydrogenase/3a,7a,12a-trihydroxy-5b-cholest-24-enoyl-CoA hydratase